LQRDKVNALSQRLIQVIGNRIYGLVIISVVTLLGAVWTAASTIPAEETSSGMISSPQKGFLAPDFNLESLDGDEVLLSELRGRVVVVNLWASWCSPCRAEMPVLQIAHEEFEAQGLTVLGVNMTYQDSFTEASSFASEVGLTFPILFDYSGEVARLYRIRALPTTYFIDREGVVREVIVGGSLNEATIRSVVTDLLEGSY
jgi:peroxiredoxin